MPSPASTPSEARARRTPAANQGRRDELRCDRIEAGNPVAKRVVDAAQSTRHGLELPLAMGSSSIGLERGIEGLGAWRLDGLPLSVWYFERAEITGWSCAGSHCARKRAAAAVLEGDVILARGRLWVDPRACTIGGERGYSAWF